MHRKTLLAAVAAGSLLGLASAARAVPAVVAPPGVQPPGASAVSVQPAPPPPLFEAMPAPRSGFVWSPGHYEWRGDHYAWVPGEWIRARDGFAWQPGHWEQRADGSWRFVAGHWIELDEVAFADRHGPFGDQDGDGILNRDDRFPHDPTRY